MEILKQKIPEIKTNNKPTPANNHFAKISPFPHCIFILKKKYEMTKLTITGNFDKHNNQQIKLNVADISRVAYLNGQICIFLSGQSSLKPNVSMASIESTLSDFPFLRVNTSHIINLEHIVNIVFGEQTVLTLRDNFQLTVDENIAMLMKKYLNK